MHNPDPKEFIYGVAAVLEAVESGKELNKILIQRGMEKERFEKIRLALKGHQYPLQFVPKDKLDRVTRKNHQGIIAFVSPIEYADLNALVDELFSKGEVPLLLALDRVTDVRNFGAIARSAECFGAHGILVPELGSVTVGGDAVKTSAGALLRIPVGRCRDLADRLRMLQTQGLQVVCISEHSDGSLAQAPLADPCVMVMGSEKDGISEEIMKLADFRARIPMSGKISSLNVSVAAGVALYESQMQRE